MGAAKGWWTRSPGASRISGGRWNPGRLREYTAANVEFHSAIIEVSGNSYVVAQLHVARVTAQVFTEVLDEEARAL